MGRGGSALPKTSDRTSTATHPPGFVEYEEAAPPQRAGRRTLPTASRAGLQPGA